MARAAKAADDKAAEPTTTDPAEAEPTIEEYEQHRLDVIARLPKEEDRPKNIYARLAQINGLIGMIRKTGKNQFHNYRYAKESDLVEEIRPMLSEYGIWIEQGLVSSDDGDSLVPHQRLSQFKKSDQSTAKTLTAITKRFRFVWWNPEGGATKADGVGALQTTDWVYFMGYGDDSGDKGYYKAETGAVKYFLMKTFMVATGDDPEGDTRADQRAAARDATNVEVRGRRGPAAQPGGRQQDASQPQIKMVGELLKTAGAGQAIRAIPLIEELTGEKIEVDPEDIPGSLVKHLQQMKPDAIGKLIYDLRKRTEGQPQSTSAANGSGTSEVADETTGSSAGDAGDGIDPPHATDDDLVVDAAVE